MWWLESFFLCLVLCGESVYKIFGELGIFRIKNIRDATFRESGTMGVERIGHFDESAAYAPHERTSAEYIAQFHGFVNMFHKFSIEKTQNFEPSSPSRDASKVGYLVPFIPKHDTIIMDAAAHCKHFFNLFLSHSKPV